MNNQQDAKTKRVVFVRNGISELGNEHRLIGWFDSYAIIYCAKDAHESAKEILDHGYTFDVAFSSNLTRARKFLKIILEDLHLEHIPTYHSWRLNERHQGWLTGSKKSTTACRYGAQQSLHWSLFTDNPPVMTNKHEYYSTIEASCTAWGVPKSEIPNVETIENVVERIRPYWEEFIGHFIRNDQRVLVIVHEDSYRAFVKLMQNFDEHPTSSITVPPPTMPIYYDLTDDLKSSSMHMGFICGDDKQREWLKERWNTYTTPFY